jgi:peptidyl-tRNA hydrolase, PTH2 family
MTSGRVPTKLSFVFPKRNKQTESGLGSESSSVVYALALAPRDRCAARVWLPVGFASLAMSRGVRTAAVNRVLDVTGSSVQVGADTRSKNIQGLSRAAQKGGGRLKFAYSRKLRIGLPCFIAGFATCAWMGFIKKPAVIKKVVRKKKPAPRRGPIIEELSDDDDAAALTVPSMSATNPNEEMKLVLVVNADLGMGSGKIAAQCCHATLALYQSLEGKHRNVLRQWEAEGQKKIALKSKESEMNGLLALAEKQRLPCYLVSDAGRTQVKQGAHTVLAIGPAPGSVVDAITGKLRLL